MSQAQQSTPMIAQIKQIIENHYHNLPKKLLNEKVRTQIIPILITLFFQGSNQQIENGSRKSIFGSNQKILNFIQNNSSEKSQDLGGEDNKQNIDNQNPSKKSRHFAFFCPNKLEQSNEDLSVDTLIKKTVAFCKLISVLENLSIAKANAQQIFVLFKERKEKIDKLKWLEKWINKNTKRTAILNFQSNYVENKKQTEACKRISKVFNLKLEKYFCTFLSKGQLTAKFSCSKEWDKLRSALVSRGIAILANKYRKNMKQSLMSIKKHNFDLNPWRTAWVRHLVYRTPSNLQTSLWRLLNFCQNSEAGENEKIVVPNGPSQEPLSVEDNESLQKIKKLRGEINRNILAVVENAASSEEIEAILFTKEQKAQILWKQLEFIYNLFSLESIIQAYSSLEQFSTQSRMISSQPADQKKMTENLILQEFEGLKKSIADKHQ